MVGLLTLIVNLCQGVWFQAFSFWRSAFAALRPGERVGYAFRSVPEDLTLASFLAKNAKVESREGREGVIPTVRGSIGWTEGFVSAIRTSRSL